MKYVSVNDPTERVDKVMDEMWITQKQCYAHYRPQLYQHFIHRCFIIIITIFFYFFKKRKNFIYFFIYSCIIFTSELHLLFEITKENINLFASKR